MKSINLFIVALLLHYVASAQEDTMLNSVELGEVFVKNTKPDKFANKVRSDNVFIVLNPTTPGVPDARQDSTYYVTRFQQPEAVPISLYAVELKLKPYDTALFDVKLIIYQQNKGDTLRKIITLDAGKIGKKDMLRAVLFEENITLQPGTFYIGFGFHSKNIPEPYRYRMYSTNKGKLQCSPLERKA